tara:strand:+ start:400 stop:696 length:297 start_codon:yes stop_codon:yes gene_type:complete
MALVSRNADICITGHGCDSEAPVIATQATVLANGRPIARQTDPVAPHTIPSGIICVSHTAFINVGNPTVLVVGKPIAFVGCSTDMGVMNTGSPNVKTG